jgi:amino acid transporter
LTGVFQLFALAYGAAGPGFWWTWPVVFLGQMMVALCFAELAAHYPIAGSIYSWSKQVAGKTVAWLAGWMMLVTIVVTVAAVALAWQVVLPQISPTFQFIGNGSGKYDFAENAVLLGSILIVLTTIVNVVGVKLMAKINNVGVFVELFASIILIVLLAIHAVRGPGVITKNARYWRRPQQRLPGSAACCLTLGDLRDVGFRDGRLRRRGDEGPPARRA